MGFGRRAYTYADTTSSEDRAESGPVYEVVGGHVVAVQRYRVHKGVECRRRVRGRRSEHKPVYREVDSPRLPERPAEVDGVSPVHLGAPPGGLVWARPEVTGRGVRVG